jgi:hypothetical protein
MEIRRVSSVVLVMVLTFAVAIVPFLESAFASGVEYGEVVVGEEAVETPPPPPPPQAYRVQKRQRVYFNGPWPPDQYDDSQSNVLRVAAYLVSPVGFLAEWLIFRPFHRIVAQTDNEPVFGHVPHEGYDYESYVEGLDTGVTFEVPYSAMQEKTLP